ncbi:hypothetical protein J2R76_003959 [Bradyrhizobium sp. USDA 4532]|nr:hypothetical protein [Bradyrhizobium sp. USDA 4545]MCP1920368.1 hypothetical protein [Bradyrhizobium sp. USDA 4532]
MTLWQSHKKRNGADFFICIWPPNSAPGMPAGGDFLFNHDWPCSGASFDFWIFRKPQLQRVLVRHRETITRPFPPLRECAVELTCRCLSLGRGLDDPSRQAIQAASAAVAHHSRPAGSDHPRYPPQGRTSGCARERVRPPAQPSFADPLAAAPARLEALFLPLPGGEVHRQGQSSSALRFWCQNLHCHQQPPCSRSTVRAAPKGATDNPYDGHTLRDVIDAPRHSRPRDRAGPCRQGLPRPQRTKFPKSSSLA